MDQSAVPLLGSKSSVEQQLLVPGSGLVFAMIGWAPQAWPGDMQEPCSQAKLTCLVSRTPMEHPRCVGGFYPLAALLHGYNPPKRRTLLPRVIFP